MSSIKFGGGSIPLTSFELPLDKFISAKMRNAYLVGSLKEEDAIKVLTELYNKVNNIKDEGVSEKAAVVSKGGIKRNPRKKP